MEIIFLNILWFFNPTWSWWTILTNFLMYFQIFLRISKWYFRFFLFHFHLELKIIVLLALFLMKNITIYTQPQIELTSHTFLISNVFLMSHVKIFLIFQMRRMVAIVLMTICLCIYESEGRDLVSSISLISKLLFVLFYLIG